MKGKELGFKCISSPNSKTLTSEVNKFLIEGVPENEILKFETNIAGGNNGGNSIKTVFITYKK